MAGDKAEVRRLMREKTATTAKGADSPFAKTLSTGRLVCTICPGVTVKNWSTHEIGAQHKRSVSEKKKASLMKPPDIIPKKHVDRKEAIPAKSILKNPLKTNPVSIGHLNSNEEVEEESVAVKRPAEQDGEEPQSKNARIDDGSHTLPEGFFDDPKLDAKARNVEYRDPKEAEWEAFQRALRDEDNKSEQVVEIDEEREMRERELHETDQMISNWEKIRELEVRKEKLQTVSTEDDDVEMDDDDESTFDEFLDWRQKAVR